MNVSPRDITERQKQTYFEIARHLLQVRPCFKGGGGNILSTLGEKKKKKANTHANTLSCLVVDETIRLRLLGRAASQDT